MSTLQRFDQDGLELVIDTQTGEAFATVSGYARMSGKALFTISERSKGVRSESIKTAQIQTPGGLQGVRLIPESVISDWVVSDNPDLARQMLKVGVRIFLYGVAGYEVKAGEPQPQPELPPADIRIVELYNALVTLGIDITNPRFSQEIKDLVTDIILTAEPGDTPKEEGSGVSEKTALVPRFHHR